MVSDEYDFVIITNIFCIMLNTALYALIGSICYFLPDPKWGTFDDLVLFALQFLGHWSPAAHKISLAHMVRYTAYHRQVFGF